jgi:RES domain-containing protein
MRLWRLSQERFAPGLDGEGARLAGGRWNSPGRALIYASATLSLAVLEVLVNLPPPMRRSGAFPRMIAIELELDEVHIAAAPDGLPDPVLCRAFGDRWIDDRRNLALRVPSAVIPQEMNLLINPAHPDLAALRLLRQLPFVFDDGLGQPAAP